ncbi:L-asparaginase [Variovorax paradoxus]|jgi:L-asparaginase|uniref:asparaginase n=1 Tax=Variovorax paradoxus TaxID=34073 RepID=UPI0006E512DB|nr:L-asparaginase [Variovorax paradoxus]KPU91488.1 L-asparaginase [Variovorax paradoxus]KPU96359.1 L-asparaginase [Variovorax paradoxus]KPV15664.1 L-asparaginase [Variovorax paradoxus]KPV23671.1 L-asparaginase [Variovorax paradoxus]
MATSSPSNPRRVVVLGTGGTISGRAANSGDNIGYTAGEVGVADLLGGIEAPAGVTLAAEQVAQVDSKDMSFAIWRALALRCAHWLAQPDVAGVVITHGTDTLEETAFFLQSVLAPRKPIVLTCAMRPASALSPDGPQNVRDAIAVAATPDAQGVTAVCAGTVLGAFDVQKVHTYRLDAFDAGDAGPVGYVEEGEVRRVRDWPASEAGAAFGRLPEDEAAWPRVEIVMSHAGASGALIHALRADGTAASPLRGLVLATTGNGTLHHALEAAALEAQEAGIAVLRATRCTQGRILPKPGDRLRDAGALTLVKARIALTLELL